MSGISRYGALVAAAMVVVAGACSSVEKQDPQEESLGEASSALTTSRYEAETMAWSGVLGTDGQVRTIPSPTHRYVWTNSHVTQSHSFLGGSTTLTR